MSAQTSYVASFTKSYAGMPADGGPKDVLGRTNESATEIPFGCAVTFGATDATVKPPGAITQVVVGIALAQMAYQPGAQLGTSGIARYAEASILRKGRIVLTAEEDVVPGDRLHVRAVAGAGGTVLGAFRKTHVDSETIDVGHAVQVLTTATAGNPFVAEVDFTSISIRQLFAVKLTAAVTAADATGTLANFKTTLLAELAKLV